MQYASIAAGLSFAITRSGATLARLAAVLQTRASNSCGRHKEPAEHALPQRRGYRARRQRRRSRRALARPARHACMATMHALQASRPRVRQGCHSVSTGMPHRIAAAQRAGRRLGIAQLASLDAQVPAAWLRQQARSLELLTLSVNVSSAPMRTGRHSSRSFQVCQQ